MTKDTKTNVLNTRASDAVTKAWRTSEKLHSSQMILFSKYFRMFKNEEVDSNYEGLSKIVVPKVFEKVIRGTAVINQAIKKIRLKRKIHMTKLQIEALKKFEKKLFKK